MGPRIGATIVGIEVMLMTRPIRFGPGGGRHHQLPDRHQQAAADALQHAEDRQRRRPRSRARRATDPAVNAISATM